MLAYRRALRASDEVDIEELKAVGDHDGLFEATRSLTMQGLLGVIEYWSEDGGRPSEPRRRETVDRAQEAFRNGESIVVENGVARYSPKALPGRKSQVKRHWIMPQSPPAGPLTVGSSVSWRTSGRIRQTSRKPCG